MKRTITLVALLCAAACAAAQDSSSASNSGSNSGSTSTATAQGNVNASQANSASGSRADSGSVSGAVGNAITVNLPAAQTGPNAGVQSLGAGGIATTRQLNELSGTTRNESVLSGTTTSNQNVTGSTSSDNTVRNVGDSTQRVVSSGGTYNIQEQRLSGTQTIRNVPSIALSGPASAPCGGLSGSLSVAGPGFGVGGNIGTVDVSCNVRESIRITGMAAQSIDGAANPQEKGEIMVMMMDQVRGLNALTRKQLDKELGTQPK